MHAKTSRSMRTPRSHGSLDLNRSVKSEQEMSLNLNKTYPRPSLWDIEPPSFDLGIDLTPVQKSKKGIGYIHFPPYKVSFLNYFYLIFAQMLQTAVVPSHHVLCHVR